MQCSLALQAAGKCIGAIQQLRSPCAVITILGNLLQYDLTRVGHHHWPFTAECELFCTLPHRSVHHASTSMVLWILWRHRSSDHHKLVLPKGIVNSVVLWLANYIPFEPLTGELQVSIHFAILRVILSNSGHTSGQAYPISRQGAPPSKEKYRGWETLATNPNDVGLHHPYWIVQVKEHIQIGGKMNHRIIGHQNRIIMTQMCV